MLDDHTTTTLALAVLGAFSGGFASGLSGFAFGMVALSFWLHAFEPGRAAPLVTSLSLVVQLASLLAVRRAIDLRRLLPLLAGGVLGNPFGVLALAVISATTIRIAVGASMIAYAALMLARPFRPFAQRAPAWLDGMVGIGSGFLGGLSGLSGILPSIWCPLRGWTKDQQRAVFQPFNSAMHVLALAGYAIAGRLDARFWGDLALCLAPVLLGAVIGLKLYGKVDEAQFRRIVLLLLLLGGGALLVQAL